MRRLLILALLVAAPAPALADAEPAPATCIEYTPACGGCAQEICKPAEDLSIPHDMAMPRDLAGPPSDGALDACRERARTRNRAHGRGLVLLSGLTTIGLFALRRRYRTMRPTPADSALAASDTRIDS